MSLKEYEVSGPSGRYTVQLSDDDAKERGLSGGKEVPVGVEFAAATGEPTPPEPVAAPETPVLADEDVSATNVQSRRAVPKK